MFRSLFLLPRFCPLVLRPHPQWAKVDTGNRVSRDRERRSRNERKTAAKAAAKANAAAKVPSGGQEGTRSPRLTAPPQLWTSEGLTVNIRRADSKQSHRYLTMSTAILISIVYHTQTQRHAHSALHADWEGPNSLLRLTACH
jgi:hypothetical protein